MRLSSIGRTSLVVACLVIAREGAAVAPLGTAFMYQGRLDSSGSPVKGTADFQFTLWSALSGPSQVAGPIAVNNVTVSGGLFTAAVDFGALVFNGDARWLEVAARTPAGSGSFTTLTPRQPLTVAPYALQTRGLFVDNAGRLGVGTNTPTSQLSLYGGLLVSDVNDEDVSFYTGNYSINNSDNEDTAYRYMSDPEQHEFFVGGSSTMIIASNGNVGIGTTSPNLRLTVASTTTAILGQGGQRGIQGNSTGTTGGTYGVFGASPSDAGAGVFGTATHATGTTAGIYGTASSSAGKGVYGEATASAGPTFGVYGSSSSSAGKGVLGTATHGSGTNYGVYGQTASANGFAGYFVGGRNYFEGNVGIGTPSPTVKLHVSGEESTGFASGVLRLDSPGGFGQIMTLDGNELNGFAGLNLNPDTSADIIMAEGGGSVGIGTASPERILDVQGRLRLRQGVPAAGGNSAGIDLYQQSPAEDRAFIGMRDDNQVGLYGRAGSGWSFVMDVTNGNIGIGTTSPAAKLHVNGTTRCDVLEIVGADLAEKFPVSEEARPGLVMEIDPENPGKLRVARGEYNRRVAGVISGANGLSAGTIMGHLPGSENAPPVALSGRVWVSCDASHDAIEVGDLLTTSSTPGHAMKVVDYPRAQGAAIGKAMTSLRHGEVGFVLVLVNLQ